MRRQIIVKMCIIAVFSALTFILTSFVGFPIANGAGYLNFSDVFILLVATLVDPVSGGLVGLIGASFADLYNGYVNYVVFTAVIKFIEGLICGYLIKVIKNKFMSVLPFLISGIIMGLLYMVPDLIYYGVTVMIFDLPFNIIQGIVCGFIGYTLYLLLKNKIGAVI